MNTNKATTMNAFSRIALAACAAMLVLTVSSRAGAQTKPSIKPPKPAAAIVSGTTAKTKRTPPELLVAPAATTVPVPAAVRADSAATKAPAVRRAPKVKKK